MRVTTSRGDDIRARFVVMALGNATRPKLLGFPVPWAFGNGHVEVSC